MHSFTDGELQLVAVKIKLKRLGKIRNPQYRIIIADARNKRDGRAIEEIGLYHPKEEPSFIKIDSDRAQYWLGVGAQPTDAVAALLKITGDWQKFRGEPGAEGTLRVKEAKPDRMSLFAAAVADGEKAKNEPKPKPKKKVDEAVADAQVAAAEAVEVAAEAVEKVAEGASDVADKAADAAKDLVEAATEKVEEAKEAVAEAKEDEPAADAMTEEATPAKES